MRKEYSKKQLHKNPKKIILSLKDNIAKINKQKI